MRTGGYCGYAVYIEPSGWGRYVRCYNKSEAVAMSLKPSFVGLFRTAGTAAAVSAAYTPASIEDHKERVFVRNMDYIDRKEAEAAWA